MTRIDEARAAVARGWTLTPLDGKKPTLVNWTRLPKCSESEAVEWATAGNVGLRTGSISGVFVIDVDTAKGGALPRELPATPTVITGGGGLHYYFKMPPVVLGNSAGTESRGIAPHVDTRGIGGQVVYPGSVHPETRHVYAWRDGCSPDDLELADLPEWVLARLIKPRRTEPRPTTGASHPYVSAAIRAECGAVSAETEGARNDRLNAAAFSLGQLVGAGALDYATAEQNLIESGRAAGLPDSEVNSTVRSGLAAGQKEPRSIPEPRKSNRTPAAEPTETTEPDAPEPAQLSIIDMVALYANKVEPVPWVIDGLLAERDICVIGGEPGSGKSVLLMSLAIALATGRPFLGIKKPTRPATVMYVDEENNRRLATRRLSMMMRGYGVEEDDLDSVRLVYATDNAINLDNGDTSLALYRQIDMAQPDWIFLDSLIRFHNRDENSNSEMSRFFGQVLKPMAARSGAGLVVLHHLAKPSKERGQDIGHRLRGASDIRAMVDQLWGIEGDSGTRKRTMTHLKNRWSDTHTPLAIEYEETGESATVTASVQSRAVEEIVRFALKGAGSAGMARQALIDTVAAEGHGSADRLVSRCLQHFRKLEMVNTRREGKESIYWWQIDYEGQN